MDKWTIMDSISSTLYIVATFVISNLNPEEIIDPTKKKIIDYYIIVVLILVWLRFFAYFLVVRTISKLLLTLIEMLGDAVAFMFIMCCFMLIMSSLF